MIPPAIALTPAPLESLLATAALRLQAATTEAERRSAWAEMKRLHVLRTPSQVARMEQARLGKAILPKAAP